MTEGVMALVPAAKIAYQPQKYKEGVQNKEGEKETLVTAINKTLKAEFRHNPDTFIWGQDVALSLIHI